MTLLFILIFQSILNNSRQCVSVNLHSKGRKNEKTLKTVGLKLGIAIALWIDVHNN